MSLSGRVGIGNIAGVATAISAGGPGAVFWMWTVAFLGASTAYIESTLGQIYKEKDDDGRYRGGPAYYIEKAMGQKWYAWIFAFTTVIATGLLLPGVQANGIAVGVQNAWGMSTPSARCLIVIALGVIIVGGVTRIATFAEIVVPFMALAYMLMAVVILVINAGRIPGALHADRQERLRDGCRLRRRCSASRSNGASGAASTRTRPGRAPGRMPQRPRRWRIRPNRDTCRRSRFTSTRCSSARRRPS